MISELFVLSLSVCFKLKDFDLFNSTKNKKQINFWAEKARICNLQVYIFGLHEINCSNSKVRGLQLQITKSFV